MTGPAHGLFSKAKREPLEAEYRAELDRLLAEVLGPAYHPNGDALIVRELARAYTTRHLCEAYYDVPEDMPKQRYDSYRAADNKILRILGDLGLSPQSRAKLGVNLAQAHSIAAKVAAQQSTVSGTARKKVEARRCACGEKPRYRRGEQIACRVCAIALGWPVPEEAQRGQA